MATDLLPRPRRSSVEVLQLVTPTPLRSSPPAPAAAPAPAQRWPLLPPPAPPEDVQLAAIARELRHGRGELI